MSHKDKATRESLASELGELKNQAWTQPSKAEDTFYQEANIEATSELGHS